MVRAWSRDIGQWSNASPERVYNRQAGAGGYHYAQQFIVGPNFTSVYNMSLRGAKKIKGQDFPP